MKGLGFLVTLLLLASCATIVNTPYAIVEITSSPDSAIVKLDNSPTEYVTPVILPLKRSRHDVLLSVEKDSLYREIVLASKLSPAFTIGNLFSWGIYGYLIDLTNPRKYTYKNELQVNLQERAVNRHHNGLNNDYRYLKLTFSIPFANNFLLYNGQNYQTSQGFWGFELGMEYYQTPNLYLSVNYGAATDFFLPFPAPIDYIGEYETNSTVYFSVRQNYIYKKFHFGIGIGIVGFNHIKHYEVFEKKSKYAYPNKGLALSSQIQYRLSKRFYAGFLYQPLTHAYRVSGLKLDYQHFISFKIDFKIGLVRLR